MSCANPPVTSCGSASLRHPDNKLSGPQCLARLRERTCTYGQEPVPPRKGRAPGRRLRVGTAVDGEVGAGDVGGLCAGDEGDEGGDFIDVAVAL